MRDVLGRVNAIWAEAADESYSSSPEGAEAQRCLTRAAQRAFASRPSRGSPGVLEESAVRIAALEGRIRHRAAAIVVAAADHASRLKV